jgi:hypothetical protein
MPVICWGPFSMAAFTAALSKAENTGGMKRDNDAMVTKSANAFLRILFLPFQRFNS